RFKGVCETIAYAHGKRVVHGDIKARNVMLGKFGETLVIDWGLAKTIARSDAGAGPPSPGSVQTLPLEPTPSDWTPTAGPKGTPAYMSPEQSRAASNLGPASDVYSLGATLYHLLSGRPPFQGRWAEVCEQVHHGEFPPPRQLDPTIDKALEAVCLKAMVLKPRDRYASALEMADDIDNWLFDRRVTAFPEPLALRAGRWIRHHPPAVAVLVTAVVALAISTVLLKGEKNRTKANAEIAKANAEIAKANELRAKKGEQRAVENEQRAVENEKNAKANALRAEKSERDANQNLNIAQILVAHSLIKEGEIRSAWELLDPSLTESPSVATDSPSAVATWPATDRGWEWYYLTGLCRLRLGMVRNPGGLVTHVVFHPNGGSYFTGDDEGNVVEWNAHTGEMLRTFWNSGRKEIGLGFGLRWHDGQLTVVSQTVLHAKRTEEDIPEPGDVVVALGDSTGRMVPVANLDAARIAALVHGPVDSQLELDAKPQAQGRVKHYKVTRRMYDCLGQSSAITALTVSPDGTLLGAAGYDKTVRLWGLDGYLFPTLVNGGAGLPDPITSIAISPNNEEFSLAVGSLVTLGSLGFDLRLMSSLNDVTGIPTEGKNLIIVAVVDNVLHFRIFDGAGKVVVDTDETRLTEQARQIEDLRRQLESLWPPHELARSDKGRVITAVTSIVDLRPIPMHAEVCGDAADRHTATVSHLGFVPKRPWLVSAAADGMLKLWDVATKKFLRTVDVNSKGTDTADRGVMHLALSPDGKRIAAVTRRGGLICWSVDDRGELKPLNKFSDKPPRFYHIAFRPNDGLLAATVYDGTVRLFDHQGVEVRKLAQHSGPVGDIAFSPDGELMAST
ncbi:MAG: protein kinase, partial [Mycolicibacterium sp.]|nr:protein kinase [Mycolicibacterium sp.]